MQRISPNKAGLALGALMVCWHLTWAIMVALGLAQPFIDFMFWLHFIKPIYVIEPFDVLRAGMLIVVTGCIGYIVGYVFGLAWNRLHR